MIVDSLILALHRASPFFHKCRVHSLGHIPACIKHRERFNNLNLNVHILLPRGIHSSTQFARWGLTTGIRTTVTWTTATRTTAT